MRQVLMFPSLYSFEGKQNGYFIAGYYNTYVAAYFISHRSFFIRFM